MTKGREQRFALGVGFRVEKREGDSTAEFAETAEGDKERRGERQGRVLAALTGGRTRAADWRRQYGPFPQSASFEQAQRRTLVESSSFQKTAFFEIAGSLWQITLQIPPPSFQMTLKSRAICRLTRPPLVVMYECTIPPTLRPQAPTSDPIHRVSLPRLVHGHLR